MEGACHDGYWIWPYQTMLYTRSPLLKEIYCESHRLEPWAVTGEASRWGHYAFPNILYVPEEERRLLLDSIPERLASGPSYALSVIDRFDRSARRLVRLLILSKRAPAAQLADAIVEESSRVLSSGVFKEMLEPDGAARLLSRFMPLAGIRDRLLALYQPLCLPHFLKFELKLLFFAARFAEDAREIHVESAIESCAHLSRFLLEDAPLSEPEAMRAELVRTMERFDRSPEAIRSERARRLGDHARAVEDAFLAERDLLLAIDRIGRTTLHTKRTIAAILRFISFLATFEELKHILTVEAARSLRRFIDHAGLPIEAVDRRAILRRSVSSTVG
jgi:hypothetical protein